MTEYKIKLTHNDINTFVNAASRSEFDIDIFYNHYIIDAKSLIGVCSLDLNHTCTVRGHGYDAAFEASIAPFLTKESAA